MCRYVLHVAQCLSSAECGDPGMAGPRTQPASFALTAASLLLAALIAHGCEVALQELRRFQPVLVGWSEQQGRYQFQYPSPDGLVHYAEGQRAALLCPGANNSLSLGEAQWLLAECRDGRLLSTAGDPLPTHLHCTLPPAGSLMPDDRPCTSAAHQAAGSEHRQLQIVFQFGEHYVPLVDICFDTSNQTPLYSKYELAKEIGNHRSAGYAANVSWWEGSGLYSYDVAGAYADQEDTLRKILGSRDLAEGYASGALPPEVQEARVERHGLREKCWDEGEGRSQCYLSEGHLAAEEDFVYVAQQFATFYHANSAPQWHSIKNRNWQRVGEAVRHYASSRQADLEVYVGMYGVARVEVPGHGRTQLHLHYEGDDDARTPVPEQLWKLVVDRARNRGAVFLVHNNPYLTAEQAESSRLNCSSGMSSAAVLGEAGWTDVGQGYTYYCSVRDFLQLLPLLPRLATADMQPLSLLAAN